MISIEFQSKIIGKGAGHLGYCIERWWCFLGVTLIYRKSVGKRGIVNQEERK